MRIGLVRHFKVNIKKRRYMTAEEYNKYTSDYDIAGVIPNEVVIDKDWDKCYCSTLPRALTTARTIYHGDIIPMDGLVEIPATAVFKHKFHISYNLWAIFSRIAWAWNHVSHPEGKRRTLQRVNEALETILLQKEESILIVSHAGTLFEIQKILRKKGFRGDRFIKAKNGKLYVYEKK